MPAGQSRAGHSATETAAQHLRTAEVAVQAVGQR